MGLYESFKTLEVSTKSDNNLFLNPVKLLTILFSKFLPVLIIPFSIVCEVDKIFCLSVLPAGIIPSRIS